MRADSLALDCVSSSDEVEARADQLSVPWAALWVLSKKKHAMPLLAFIFASVPSACWLTFLASGLAGRLTTLRVCGLDGVFKLMEAFLLRVMLCVSTCVRLLVMA